MPCSVRAFGLAAFTIATAACSGSTDIASTADGLAAIAFHAEAAALPDVKADTGLQPSSSPVQLQLTVAADAKTTVDAAAYASGSSDAPVLTAKAGSGKLAVKGGFGLNARLVVSMKGIPSYDGPVPGIENSTIAFSGESSFDPYVLDGQVVTVRANIPAVNLPDIPLPGGLPGSLRIQIAEGSTVGAELRGTCAAIEGTTAQYTGTLAHSGNLVLKPTIELDIPLVGKKSYALPDVTLPIAVPARAIDLGSPSVTFGTTPAAGDVASVGHCDGTTGVPADSSTTDSGIRDSARSDAGVDGAKTDAASAQPGTATECAARANGDRDSYIACCKENTQGWKEASAIVQATACSTSVCLKSCASSYCANASPDGSCVSCLELNSSQVSFDNALGSQCTSETCARYDACVRAAPPRP
jgi:hypothetical protein